MIILVKLLKRTQRQVQETVGLTAGRFFVFAGVDCWAPNLLFPAVTNLQFTNSKALQDRVFEYSVLLQRMLCCCFKLIGVASSAGMGEVEAVAQVLENSLASTG